MKKISELLGLKAEEAAQLGGKLNELLANYQMFYQNLRGFHWNIRGNKFFELHAKFEELYDDAVLKVDEVAERILTLGETPLHTFTDYLKVSTIKEAKGINDGTATVETTLENLSTLIRLEREILPLANEAGDEGTLTLLTDYISQQEKVVWMLSAYLK
ncbi:Dps family protein [Alkaliflexus imshenetskii]|uniref:Dps family protein n=1 Tax=Alkaliflexus imshenetskii TaxID=286730 RepID=UPI00047C31C0|nr:Dps family protein [Alkaliflexus imshenetskii]